MPASRQPTERIAAPDTARAEVERLVSLYAGQADHYASATYNETQARRDFIDPFFAALGWDVDGAGGGAMDGVNGVDTEVVSWLAPAVALLGAACSIIYTCMTHRIARQAKRQADAAMQQAEGVLIQGAPQLYMKPDQHKHSGSYNGAGPSLAYRLANASGDHAVEIHTDVFLCLPIGGAGEVRSELITLRTCLPGRRGEGALGVG